MPSEMDVAPKAISGTDGIGLDKPLCGAMLRAPLLLILLVIIEGHKLAPKQGPGSM